ncbi:MAG: hypothetical protein QF926_15890 [Alphaproteobacteria bacterium]|jgi:hypothetical protein|nr:hypothetical protein [Alphaproteobacteria bacterium]MDP6518086.1 hypothetical protein [Alphaproteobacteria bacterium]
MVKTTITAIGIGAAIVLVIGIVGLSGGRFGQEPPEAATADGFPPLGEYVALACERMVERVMIGYSDYQRIDLSHGDIVAVEFVAQDPDGALFRGRGECTFAGDEKFPPLQSLVINDLVHPLDEALQAYWMLDVGDALAEVQDIRAFADIMPAAGGEGARE